MTSEKTLALLLLAAFVVYFGPAILRVILKPEHGSVTDLRIAKFESFLMDFDKRAKISEKLATKLKEKPEQDRDTLPPAPPPET